MPKLNDLTLLFPVSNNEHVPNSDYYLFMLGTDTVFTRKPTKNSKKSTKQKTYENGETLSYMAQLIASCLNEGEPEIRKDQPLAFSTPSVDVLIGPKTKGHEVGERIAQGIFLILKAIAEGKENIQIAAHSRGAVESILIAHELERIKKAFESNTKTLYQILLDSPCGYTRKAVRYFYKEINESKESRMELLHRLSNAKLNMFLMDPVPGSRWNGINLYAWDDERFYPAVPCSKAELLLFRDERTKCFMPIKPKGLVPLVIPGHHGTASGNLYSQQFVPVPEKIECKDTALVQELVLLKLLNFINNNSDLFKNYSVPVNLNHPVLDKLTNEYLKLEPKERADFLLHFYKEVHRNDAAYRHFATTSYSSILGSEFSSSGARLVQADGPNATSLDTLSPSLGGQFINKEHAFLYLWKHMGFKLDEDLPHELIPELSKVLINILEGYTNPIQSQSVDMSQSIGPKAVALLEAEPDRKATFEAISIFLDTISQKYLRNHLSVDIKTKLLADIHSLFDVLQKFKNSERPDAPINQIIDECDYILRTSLKDTVKKHYETLVDQSNRFNDKTVYFLTTKEAFNEAFHHFLKTLDLSSTEENERSALIKLISVRLKQIDPITIEEVKRVLRQQLLELEKQDNTTLATDVISHIIKLTSGTSINLEGFFEAHDLGVSVLLSELDGLYDNFDSLINGFAHVQQLSGTIPLDIKLNDLIMYRSRIVRMAAEVFVNKQIDLRNKPEVISDAFFDIVKRQAIALGAPNPEVNDLFREVDHLRSLLADNSEQIRQLQLGLQEQFEYSRQSYQALIKQININESSLTDLSLQLSEKSKANAMQTKLLTQQIELLAQELLVNKSALEELNQQFNDYRKANNTEVESLVLEQQRLMKQLADNNQESSARIESLVKEQQLLAESKQESDTHIERLTQAQQLLVKQLIESNQESSARIESLIKEQRLLAESKQESDTRVERLTQEQQLLVKQLVESKSAHDELARQLNANKQASNDDIQRLQQQQDKLAEEKAEDKLALEHLANELAQTRKEFAEALKTIQEQQLSRNVSTIEENQQISDRLIRQEQLIQKLISPNELKCSRLIESKLIPLTQAYLVHLIAAARNVNPIVENKQVYDALPDFAGNDSDQEQYFMIMEKYSITKNLLNQLEDKQSKPLPSERITQFTQSLNNSNDQLKKHRDSEWMQYFKGCMVAIGLICTGIIPGLAVLLAYTSYTGKSSPMFFNNTAGEEFAYQAKSSLEQVAELKS